MSAISKQVIQFANHRSAVIALSPAEAAPQDILQTLAVPPAQAIILSIGGADDLDQTLLPRLTQLYGRGIAKAAQEAKAIVLDGGTQSGVMQLMGEAVSAHGHNTTLIGVAPRSKVIYPGSEAASGTALEPNHSHFILVEGEQWGSETSTLFSVLAALREKQGTAEINSLNDRYKQKSQAVKKVPAVAILAGGGTLARTEVLRIVRQSLPLIVVEGSGGLADEIAAAYQEKDKETDDPFMAEVIADGELHFHLLANSVKGIERLIIRELGSDKILVQAWETFADYDLNANRQQKRFDKLQQSVIALGVVSVALVVIQQVFAPRDAEGDLLPATLGQAGFWWWSVYHLLILIPIVLTILITAANRFKQGNKWLLLRAGAEAIKREIYRYRTRTLLYANDAEQHLAKAIEEITRRTMRTEVNMSALVRYDKENGFPPYMYVTSADDGFGCLSPDRYVEVRLGDQLSFFQRKTVRLEKQLRRLYWLTFIIGGIGTFLASIGLQAWVALTTSLVAAFGTYLGYRQTESTLTKYNQTATDLANVKAWWDALSAEEQARQVNINSLVDHTEQVLQSELDGWVQQMQNALADLRKGQESTRTQSEVLETKITRELTVTQTKTQQTAGAEETQQDEAEVAEITDEQPATEVKAADTKEKIEPVGRFE